MRLLRTVTPAVLILIGLTAAGCGSGDSPADAAAAARVSEMDAQADHDLEETLAALAEAEAAMRPRIPAPELTYDAFRGEAIDPDASKPVEQTAVVVIE